MGKNTRGHKLMRYLNKTYLDIRDGAASIGIIGGADGPTEIFVTAG